MVGFGSLFGRTPHRIDSGTVTRLVDAGALLLDVRTSREHAAGSPSGAVNIPVQELQGRLNELPTDRTIVAYCRSGIRSASAVHQLVAEGFDAHDAGAIRNVM